jgi:hypothetical protein
MKILSNICVYQNTDQTTIGDDKLAKQIDKEIKRQHKHIMLLHFIS